MKIIYSIFLIGFLLLSCNKEEKVNDNYVITGNAKGIYNGIRVYLKTIPEAGQEIIRDTAIVIDEKFKFEGKIEIPEMWYLSVNSVAGNVPFIIENKNLSIDVDKDNITESQIIGSKANKEFYLYSKEFKELSEELKTLTRQSAMTFETNEIEILDTKISNLSNQIKNLPSKFLKKNPDNIFSLILIETLIKNNPFDVENINYQFENLDKNLTSSYFGQQLSTQMAAIKSELERNNSVDIGKLAPDFSAPKTDGQLLALNDIKGKVTIIDFWASWCGPCRRENPNVVNVYNKYHNKGLEIIGVSLDRPNQKDKWLKAIEDDKLNWHHVSNLQYFNDPVAQLYNIKSIPATYILDSNGTIVAKNLRGPALEAKIAELLN